MHSNGFEVAPEKSNQEREAQQQRAVKESAKGREESTLKDFEKVDEVVRQDAPVWFPATGGSIREKSREALDDS